MCVVANQSGERESDQRFWRLHHRWSQTDDWQLQNGATRPVPRARRSPEAGDAEATSDARRSHHQLQRVCSCEAVCGDSNNVIQRRYM